MSEQVSDPVSSLVPIKMAPFDYDLGRQAFQSFDMITTIVPTDGQAPANSKTEAVDVSLLLPANKVFNLFETQLIGRFTQAAPATAGRCAFRHARPQVERIRLANASNMAIIDVSMFQQYSDYVSPLFMEGQEFKHKVDSDVHCPNRVLKSSIQAVYPAANAYNGGSVDYDEMKYIKSAAAGSTIVDDFKWKLGELAPTTFLGINQNISFPEQLYLTITLAPENSFTWMGSNQGDPSENAAISDSAAGVYSGVKLLLKVETDPDLQKAVLAKCGPGFSMGIPFTKVERKTILANSGTFSFDFPYLATAGTELRYNIWTIYGSNVSTTHTSGDNQNLAGARMTNYHTELNSNRLQADNIDCATSFQDFEYNRRVGGSSPIVQTRETYQKRWHHFDNWCYLPPLGKEVGIQRANITGGIALSRPSQSNNPVTYNVSGTLSSGANPAMFLYMTSVTTKTLMNEGGVVMVK